MEKGKLRKRKSVLLTSCMIVAGMLSLKSVCSASSNIPTYKWGGTVTTGQSHYTNTKDKSNTSPVWVSYTSGSKMYSIDVAIEGKKGNDGKFNNYTYPDYDVSWYTISLNSSKYCSSYVREKCGSDAKVRLKITPQHGGDYKGSWMPDAYK